MHKNAEKDVEEITNRVLKDNALLISNTNPESVELLEETMQKYGVIFYKGIKKNAQNMTYGMQLGATKRFCDFSLKCFTNLNLAIKTEKLAEFFDTITPSAINLTAGLENAGMAVYGIIKELKIYIDKAAEEKFL